MKVHAMFFADSAALVDDRLNVTGGLWDGLTATGFPASHEINIVVILRPDGPSDVGQSVHLDFPVIGPDGTQTSHQHVDVVLNVFRQQTAIVVPVQGSFPVAGRYTLTLQSQIGTDSLSFDVVGRDGASPVAAAVEGYALGLNR